MQEQFARMVNAQKQRERYAGGLPKKGAV